MAFRPVPDCVLRDIDRLVDVVGSRFQGWCIDAENVPCVDVLVGDEVVRYRGQSLRQALRLAREAEEVSCPA